MSNEMMKMNQTKAASRIGLTCLVILSFAGCSFGQEVAAIPASAAAIGSSAPFAQSADAPQQAAPGTGDRLHLLVGRSLVISSPTRVKRISIADPNIVEAIVISPFQVLLNGKTAGGVSLVIWDESDQSQTFEIFVDMDILGLSQKIREVFPNEPIRVEARSEEHTSELQSLRNL